MLIDMLRCIKHMEADCAWLQQLAAECSPTNFLDQVADRNVGVDVNRDSASAIKQYNLRCAAQSGMPDSQQWFSEVFVPGI